MMFDAGRRTACALLAAATLAACNAFQSAPATAVIAGPAKEVPAARLLYVSYRVNAVDVYSYPKGNYVGELTGFTSASGECVDGAGDVFITDQRAGDIVEYPHGGISPKAILNDEGQQPFQCAVDPTSGNLAVTNYGGSSSGGGPVAVYPYLKAGGGYGFPRSYAASWIQAGYYCAYDNKGNLFIDGPSGEHVGFGELPAGGKRIITLNFSRRFGQAPGLQWDGKYLAVMLSERSSASILRYSVENGVTTHRGNTTLADGLGVLFAFSGTSVIASSIYSNVAIWNYPAGGVPVKTYDSITNPDGLVISSATSSRAATRPGPAVR